MPRAKINLKRFTYSNGSETWRVSGSVDGQQYRKNFKDRKKALEYKQELEVKQLNGPEYGRHMWVKITPEEHDDAFTALRLLKKAKSPRGLTFAVQYFIENYKEWDNSYILGSAVDKYLKARENDVQAKELQATSYRMISQTLRKVQATFGKESPLATITTDEVSAYISSLNNGKPSKKTCNNIRGILSTFFKWCLAEDMITKNPIGSIRNFRLKKARATAETLTTEQVAEMMAFAEDFPGPSSRFPRDDRRGMLVPYLALAVFGGIRPSIKDGELHKIDPRSITLDLGIITIEPDVAKTKERRKINVQPNLAIWLAKYPLDRYPIMPENRGFMYAIARLRRKFKIPHDGLRHTYISMLVGSFRSVGDAALQAGNSESIIKSHYLALKPIEEADAFWRIVPKGETIPELIKVREEGKFIRPEDRDNYLGVI